MPDLQLYVTTSKTTVSTTAARTNGTAAYLAAGTIIAGRSFGQPENMFIVDPVSGWVHPTVSGGISSLVRARAVQLMPPLA